MINLNQFKSSKVKTSQNVCKSTTKTTPLEDNKPPQKIKSTKSVETRIEKPQGNYYEPIDLFKKNNVEFVDNKAKLIEMVKKFKELKPSIIALDCEWSFWNRPKPGEIRIASLIQIATHQKVYLIDIKFFLATLKLNNSILLDKFFDTVFFDKDIIKLGFAFHNDLTLLKGLFPHRRDEFNVFAKAVFDIQVLEAKFEKRLVKHGHRSSSIKLRIHNEKSLSTVTEQCFGLPLSKGGRKKNWNMRPLTENMIKYAALDAFVLLEINDFYRGKCIEYGIGEFLIQK